MAFRLLFVRRSRSRVSIALKTKRTSIFCQNTADTPHIFGVSKAGNSLGRTAASKTDRSVQLFEKWGNETEIRLWEALEWTANYKAIAKPAPV